MSCRFRFVWVAEVEGLQQLWCVPQISCGNPGCFFICSFVSRPMDEVVKCIIRAEMAVQFGVQYLADFIFNVTFNLHRWWWWLVSEWEWVWCGDF